MVDIAHKASLPAKKNGLSNVLLVVANAERLPGELLGLASEITIWFPWGSLLHMVLSAQEQFIDGVRAVSRDGATLRVLFSLEPTIEKKVIEQCNISALDPNMLDALRHSYARCGIELSWRMISQELLKAFNSSWGKRLAFGRPRPCVELTGRIIKKSDSAT